MSALVPAVRAVAAVPAAALVTGGLIGGYATARATGVRPLGGVVLAAAGAAAGTSWWRRGGPAATAGLAGLYVLGFGLSHPLAKKIGAWPSVLSVAAVNGAVNWAVVDRAPGRADQSPTASRPRRTISGSGGWTTAGSLSS